jgi:surface polysaccharide O-acyltransferase-like enzyme
MNDTSERIEMLRFPLIVGVVFLHNYGLTVHMAAGDVGTTSDFTVSFVEDVISQGVCRCVVPLFFLISGYLFFLGDWSKAEYLRKIQGRVRTLLIPFLFWNLLTLSFICFGQSLPQTRMFFSGALWSSSGHHSALDYANAILGLQTATPISYQFWFIRDLMALVIAAPLIHLALSRRVAILFLGVLSVLWLANHWPLLWPSVDACICFSIGAYLAIIRADMTALDSRGVAICGVFLTILFVDAADQDHWLLIHKAMITLGVLTSWWLTRFAVSSTSVRKTLMKLRNDSFFVFAAHEPLLRIIRKFALKLLHPTSHLAQLSFYFAIPILLIIVLVVTHRVLMWALPVITGITTGNRYRNVPQAA